MSDLIPDEFKWLILLYVIAAVGFIFGIGLLIGKFL